MEVGRSEPYRSRAPRGYATCSSHAVAIDRPEETLFWKQKSGPWLPRPGLAETHDVPRFLACGCLPELSFFLSSGSGRTRPGLLESLHYSGSIRLTGS